MNESQSYSIVQYYADADRHEGLNLGVLLFDHDQKKVRSRFTRDFSRVLKLVSGLNKSFLQLALEEFEKRVQFEISGQTSISSLKRFQSMRSNNIRLTPIMPTFAVDAEEEIDRLFDELVGDDKATARRKKVGSELKAGLRGLNLLRFFDQNPEPVSLPRYNVRLKPDLTIRRDRFNLIEAARFDDPEIGIGEAGRHSLAGKALFSSLDMQLIIVGDFGEQSDDYFNSIQEDLEAANTKLYRLSDISGLARDYVFH